MEEKDIISKYREQMENHSTPAPEGLWEDVANQLDIDDVWDNISAELNKTEQHNPLWFWIPRVAAAALILFTLSFAFWYMWPQAVPVAENSPGLAPVSTDNNDPQTSITNQQQDTPIETTEPSVSQIESANYAGIPNLPNSITTPEALSQPSLAQSQENNPASNESETISAIQEEPLLAGITPQNAYVNPSDEILSDAAEDLLNSEYFSNRKLISFIGSAISNYNPSFSLGLSSGIKNTWMFNQETFNGLDRLNHNRTGMKFYPDLGLAFKYQPLQHWSFETDIFFSSATGQVYMQYINGKFTERNISLRYFQSEFLTGYHYNVRLWNNQNSLRMKTVAGMYASLLNTATETRGNESYDISARFRNTDYGFVAGQHINFQLGQRWVLSPGIRFKYGLANIYAGGSDPFSTMQNTHNMSIEFRFNVYFDLSRSR